MRRSPYSHKEGESKFLDFFDSSSTYVTEYLGSPALLSEPIADINLFTSAVTVLSLLRDLKHTQEHFNRFNGIIPDNLHFWILGASYNYTLRSDAKRDLKCDSNSCYEQSLQVGKICKPGMFHYLKYIFIYELTFFFSQCDCGILYMPHI